MPKRTRSHELEELSIARFNDLLPAKWVSRPKLPDYGIDREVEIFDPNGNSTGLSFLVQLRATDNAEIADRVVLETDELDYYAQLDLPVLVARYGSAENRFYCQWDSVIRARVSLGEGQASVTYRFSEAERWGEETPAAIRRMLEVRRALANYPQGAAVPVRLDLSRLPPASRYPVERALGKAIGDCSGALTRPRETRLVEVDIVPEEGFLAVRFDAVASVTFDLPGAGPDLIANSALYALAKLFSHKGLVRQGETVARTILARGSPHHSEKLALSACQALGADPGALVELAILNGFHHQGAAYGAVLFEISRSRRDDAVKNEASDRFFAAALDVAEGADSIASVHYSIAQHYRGPATRLRSLHHYNRARHLRPVYLTTSYFLRDLGGLLYESGRPRCAAVAYRAALPASQDPIQPLLLGDALLLSGELAEAEQLFAIVAAEHPRGVVVQEAELKRLVCEWLRGELGLDRVPLRRREAYAAMSPDGSDSAEQLWAVVRALDGLNPLAHFNFGIRCRDAGRAHDAVPHFLACAFVQPGDVEAWSNAASCAFASQQGELVLGILAVAVERNGAGAYDRLRADLDAAGIGAEALAELDTVALTLIGESQASDPAAFTMRLLDGDGFETLTIIDP